MTTEVIERRFVSEARALQVSEPAIYGHEGRHSWFMDIIAHRNHAVPDRAGAVDRLERHGKGLARSLDSDGVRARKIWREVSRRAGQGPQAAGQGSQSQHRRGRAVRSAPRLPRAAGHWPSPRAPLAAMVGLGVNGTPRSGPESRSGSAIFITDAELITVTFRGANPGTAYRQHLSKGQIDIEFAPLAEAFVRVTNAELDPNAPSTPAELVEIESKHVSVKMPMTKLHKTPSLTYINRVREALS